MSQIVSVITSRLLSREWLELRDRLAALYHLHVTAGVYHTTDLAEQLLILGEDHRFFSHGGIDSIAICRAIWRGLILRRREGASTIPMQIVRVVSGRFERTFRRKVREMALATLVTKEIPKETLPAIYLQIGYYGWHMNGFTEACQHLGLNADALTPTQTAQLVARLKYPQPREVSPERWNLINIRAQHLLKLHSRLKRDRILVGLINKPSHETV